MDDNKKIIERIRKLLAVAASSSGASENEMEIAMRRAHALIAQHNIDITLVENSPEKEEPVGTDTFHWGKTGNANRAGPWSRFIAMAIAKLNFCGYYYTRVGSHSDAHIFIGHEVNRTVARMVSQYVIDTIAAEARQQARLNPDDKAYLNTFRNAAAKRIVARCDAMVREATAADSAPGTALALRNAYEREAQAVRSYKEEKLDLRTRRQNARGGSVTGAAAGAAAGDRVSLRPELGASTSPSPRALK